MRIMAWLFTGSTRKGRRRRKPSSFFLKIYFLIFLKNPGGGARRNDARRKLEISLYCKDREIGNGNKGYKKNFPKGLDTGGEVWYT